MTKTAAVYTDRPDSEDAGQHLGRQVREALGDDAADALIVFASSRFNHEALLTAVAAECKPKLLVGSSSAGEFTAAQRGEGTACALAIRSTEIQASAGLGLACERRSRQRLHAMSWRVFGASARTSSHTGRL